MLHTFSLVLDSWELMVPISFFMCSNNGLHSTVNIITINSNNFI